MNEAELLWNGPPWLSDPSQWPADIVTKATDDSNAEKKVQRELFALSVEANDDFDTGQSHENLCMDLAVQSQFSSPFREDHRTSHDQRNSATSERRAKGKDGQVCP